MDENKHFDVDLILNLIEKVDELTALINNKHQPSEYYRNKDLKRVFGFSENSIKKYRIKGYLPFSKIGEIHIYPVDMMNKVILENGNLKSKRFKQ